MSTPLNLGVVHAATTPIAATAAAWIAFMPKRSFLPR
jgi:hypothetical protein